MANEQTTDQLVENLRQLAAQPLDSATTLPAALYTSPEIFRRESETIFSKQWLCAGLAADIADEGDYLTYQIGTQPIIVIRQDDGCVEAFANVCRHRMMPLAEGPGKCHRNRISCPYHGWNYGIDGRLVGAPHMGTRPGFDKADYSLASVRCETWLGWIYVTLDNEIEPVGTTLEDLTALAAPYEMANYVPIVQRDHVWNTNWKLLTENFMESYHLPIAHAATVGAGFPINDTRFSPTVADPAFTYQYFEKPADAPVGNAHPKNNRLKGKQRRTSLMPTVFPSHMFVLAPDHLWYLTLQPLAADKVQIRFGAALAPEVLEHSDDPERLISETIDLLDRVNEEDRVVVEGIFKGGRSPLATAGPLCWLEQSIHEFNGYLARRLGG